MLLETLFPTVLNMSITGSIVIVVLLCLRPLMNIAPRIFAYSLWIVVLFRLLCPVTLRADFSMLGLLDLPVTEDASIEYIPSDIVSNPFPKVDFLVADATDLVNTNLPKGWDQVEEKPLADGMAVATVLWLAGFTALLTFSVHSLNKLQRSLQSAHLLRENIYLSDHLGTPLVLGIFRPKIYLPTSLTREEQDYVLMHEDYHIRRCDHVMKHLSFAALCIHWFNPLVWIAFWLSDKDMEMSCDEAVVKEMDKNTRCNYSGTLLRVAAGRLVIPGGPLCFCEGDPKGRIRNILKWKKPRRITWITGTAVSLLLCASLVTDPVFALETTQPFTGRIHLDLPEGYDYVLLDDPYFVEIRRNIVIYKESAEYAISEGCISLDFSSEGIPVSSNSMVKHHVLRNGIRVKVLEEMSNDFYNLYCETEDCGTIRIYGHNSYRWAETDVDIFRDIIGDIIITGPVQYEIVELNQGDHLAVSARELENYGLWTDEGYFCVDLAGASGEATVNLYEAYTDKLVDSFVTGDAARNDHHVFTGLTSRKEYYLTVSCNDSVTVTIFQ